MFREALSRLIMRKVYNETWSLWGSNLIMKILKNNDFCKKMKLHIKSRCRFPTLRVSRMEIWLIVYRPLDILPQRPACSSKIEQLPKLNLRMHWHHSNPENLHLHEIGGGSSCSSLGSSHAASPILDCCMLANVAGIVDPKNFPNCQRMFRKACCPTAPRTAHMTIFDPGNCSLGFQKQI